MVGYSILASAALKGSAILGAAAVASWGLRRRSAAARHLIWTGAAAALLALPLLTLTLPALRLPAAPKGPMAVFQVFSSSATAPWGARGSSSAVVAAGVRGAARKLDVPTLAVALWAAGASIGLLQMLFAFAALARLRRTARAFDASDLVDAPDADILESDRCGMPLTFGVLRPVVLLPADATDWNPERLRCVLLHELAHVRRGDVATHLLARTALALYWWNPLAWFAWREFLKERERATDDLVLHAGARASEYAGHLLEVARSLRPAPATAWAAIAMARRSQLEGRLLAILDSKVDRTPSRRRSAAVAAILAVGVIAPFAAMQAQDPALPPEVDATIRAANSQKNHQLLDNAAAAYEKTARYEIANQLLVKSLSLREQVSGANSAAYAAGLVKLGDLAVVRRQLNEATAFYKQAVSLGDRAEVAPALVYLGIEAFDNRNRGEAEDYLQRALAIQGKGQNAGRALTWLAVLRQSTPGGEPEAETLYQRGIAELDPKSGAAYTALQGYARLLRRENRMSEAEALEARARTVPLPRIDAAVSSSNAYRVGGGVSAPALLYKVEPAYTESARTAKIAGTVLLYVEVQPAGTAANIQVRRSIDPGLDQQAIAAVQRWRFRPGMKDGVPVTVAATIEVNFRLL